MATISRTPPPLIPGPTFDASTLPEPQREQFHRNLRTVEQVLAGATQSSVAEKEGIHTKRKTNANVSGERWATSGKTDRNVVGGERMDGKN